MTYNDLFKSDKNIILIWLRENFTDTMKGTFFFYSFDTRKMMFRINWRLHSFTAKKYDLTVKELSKEQKESLSEFFNENSNIHRTDSTVLR